MFEKIIETLKKGNLGSDAIIFHKQNMHYR